MSDSTTSTIAPELLTTKQAAALCNCGERTFWRLSRCGISPRPIKLGPGKKSLVRYSRAALVEWIQGGCKPLRAE